MTKPSRKGPLIALALSVMTTMSAFSDAFIDREEDASSALIGLPITLIFVWLSWRWLSRRLDALERWKDERFRTWILKDLPEEN